jgi:hypothetical protein
MTPVLAGIGPWMAEGRPADSQKMQEQFSAQKGDWSRSDVSMFMKFFIARLMSMGNTVTASAYSE